MNLLSALTTYNVNSNKIRIGNQHDGGYIINDLIVKNTKRLISVGIGGEDNFELQWAEKFPTTFIEAYDGTYPCNNLCNKFPDRINKNIFYVHNDVGYGDKQIPLNTIVDSKEGVLLKVDIEGGEYTAFDNLYPDRNLTGLILEIHDLHIPENCQKIAKIITENFKNLLLFHVHGNSWGGMFDLNLTPSVNDGILIKRFPHVLELTFISKHIVDGYSLEKGKFPVDGLDNTNRHDFPDIDLYWINAI
jgi:hypothetical protein